MKIEIVSLSAAGEDEIIASLELRAADRCERKRFLLPSSAYVELGLRRGECDLAQYDRIEHASQIYAAYKRGLALLGFGARSERMLVSKLISKGIDKKIAIEAVALLRERGFIDEGESAKREAERAAEKLWGERRIKEHLRFKGYGDASVDAAMFALEDGGVDFEASCIRLVEQKCKAGRLPKEREEMQKLIASVMRYGYGASEVKRALSKIASRKPSIYG